MTRRFDKCLAAKRFGDSHGIASPCSSFYVICWSATGRLALGYFIRDAPSFLGLPLPAYRSSATSDKLYMGYSLLYGYTIVVDHTVHVVYRAVNRLRTFLCVMF